jgi:hypothetical protein
MAEPIINDWKAIHDRMQQIEAERSASFQRCPQCNDRGWIPSFVEGREPNMVGYVVCNLCYNPYRLAQPRAAHRR